MRRPTLLRICLAPLIFFTGTASSLADLPSSMTLRFKDSEEAIVRPAVVASLKRIIAFYKKEYGITLTRRVVVIASQDPEYLAQTRFRVHKRRLPLDGMQAFSRRQCGRAKQVTGAADSHTLRICFKSELPITAAWLEFAQEKLDTVVAHEFRHVIQRQFSNSNYFRKGGRPKHGPKWMVEGDAVYVHMQYVKKKFRKDRSLKRIMKWASRTKTSLTKLKEGGNLLPSSGYGLATFGTVLLIERFGEKRMQAYWKNLKRGKGWEATFRETFGFSMASYMAKVEKLRRNPAAARRWIAGR